MGMRRRNPVQHEGNGGRGSGGTGRRRRPTLFSRRVLRVEYEHVDDPRDVARVHEFGPGVYMYAEPDGSVLMRHRDHPRKKVWADLPGED